MPTSVLSELIPDRNSVTLSKNEPTDLVLHFLAMSDPYSANVAVEYSLSGENDVWFIDGEELKKNVTTNATITAEQTEVENAVRLVRGPGESVETFRVTANVRTPGEMSDPQSPECVIHVKG